WFLDKNGEPTQVKLRERPAEAPMLPLAREPCGPEIADALRQLEQGTSDTEFKAGVLEWLGRWYRPETTLADAFAQALDALLGPRGLVVLRVHDPRAKRAAAPWVLKGLVVTLPDGYTPVLVDASQGRDRLQRDGDGFVTRRSGERFSRAELERLARDAPERLSPNVLLRPAVEAALLPTLAYAGGPAELKYLPDAAPLYETLGLTRQAPVPRWSGVLVESRVEKLMERHGLDLAADDGQPGELEARLVRDELATETLATLAALRHGIEEHYAAQRGEGRQRFRRELVAQRGPLGRADHRKEAGGEPEASRGRDADPSDRPCARRGVPAGPAAGARAHVALVLAALRAGARGRARAGGGAVGGRLVECSHVDLGGRAARRPHDSHHRDPGRFAPGALVRPAARGRRRS